MLTRLRFKNWRSLRDVTIDNLTPITVFVGANSSGKSNILDALYFVRYAMEKGILEAVLQWGGYDHIRTVNTDNNNLTQIEFTFQPGFSFNADGERDLLPKQITYSLKFGANQDLSNFTFIESISSDGHHLSGRISSGGPLPTTEGAIVNSTLAAYLVANRNSKEIFSQSGASTPITDLLQYVTQRWQLLDFNFFPAIESPNTNSDSFFVIEPTGRNLPKMLSLIQRSSPEHFAALQEDMRHVLTHIQAVNVQESDRDIRVLLTETSAPQQASYSVSTGTARILGILTAIQMNEWLLPYSAGLVIVDEPDIGIHPYLLRNLLEIIRLYAASNDRDTGPRGFLLTTHNPQILNWFEPNEVRVVERDEQGFTTVKEVDPGVAKYWLERDGAYNVGEMWNNGLIGGVPE